MEDPKIYYTLTDEAPILATHSLLPIIKKFTRPAGISIETKDISLAARILARFPDFLSNEQKQSDALAELGDLAKQPQANIIKLPNISASVPQLEAAIKELQNQGYAVPDYPANPADEKQQAIKDAYAKVLGSAVNPVLREGNSDRRAPGAVKTYAKNNPHSMGAWTDDSRTRVASMESGDFYASEKSMTMDKTDKLSISLETADDQILALKEDLAVQKGEIIDAAVMNCRSLREFFNSAFKEAKGSGVLASLHLKATMMKVSDPIIFGHALSVYFDEIFEQYAGEFEQLEINPNNGLAELLAKLNSLPEDKAQEIQQAIQETLKQQAPLAMVDSDKGITNLHVPSHVIVDASMPAMIRNSGKMWDVNGQLNDTLAIIPDRCYAGVYQETINFHQQHGAFDPSTMGTVPNVGLMAQKAEEYGSHDKTFQIPEAGKVVVRDQQGQVLLEHEV